ncbi:ArsB/NhaD family transporter, partial [Pseudomonas aeruginosa]
ARKGMRITWGYYFRVGALLTLPVLLAPLSALALRLTICRPPGRRPSDGPAQGQG